MELIDARNNSLTAMPSNERLELYFLETGGLRNMELRQLATFLSVARHGSVTEAARRMFVSQPTVSLQIAALEKELGVLLFERQSRGVALTEAGRILMRYASDILTLADQAAQAMGRYIVDIAGTVRVAASTVPADYVCPGPWRSSRSSIPRRWWSSPGRRLAKWRSRCGATMWRSASWAHWAMLTSWRLFP